VDPAERTGGGNLRLIVRRAVGPQLDRERSDGTRLGSALGARYFVARVRRGSRSLCKGAAG
jgi:hypothetical protein